MKNQLCTKIVKMSQSSIASYFTNRKRAAADDLIGSKNKVYLIENDESSLDAAKQRPVFGGNQSSDLPADDAECCDVPQKLRPHSQKLNFLSSAPQQLATQTSNAASKDARPKAAPVFVARSTRVTRAATRKTTKTTEEPPQTTIVAFIKGGALSPRKKMTPTKPIPDKTKEQATVFSSTINQSNSDRGMKTPTKQIIKGSSSKLPELSAAEVKTALAKSSNLQDLKARLGKFQDLEARRQKLMAKNEANKKLAQSPTASPTSKGEALKHFKTIDIEVLTRYVLLHPLCLHVFLFILKLIIINVYF